MSIADTRTVDAANVRQGRPPVPRLRRVDVSPERLAELKVVLAEHAEQVDRDAAFPWAGIRAVHEAGILTATVPEKWGGHGGLAHEVVVDVFLALGEGDPATALIAAMTVFQHSFADVWPEDLYLRLLRESAERPTLINAIRAEPELGAPARGGLPATTVRRTGTGWVLNGRKAYGTGSEGLAYHLVWAVTEPGLHPAEGSDRLIGHVIVPSASEDGTPTPGIRIEKTWDHLGQRGTSTHDIVYDNVEVPEVNFRGSPVGSVPNNGNLTGVALAVPALYLGVARAAQAFFTRFANERVPSALGAPIATTDRIRSVAGEIEVQLVTAEEFLRSTARRLDSGEDASRQLQAAKTVVTRAAIDAVQTAVAALGNPALSRSNPLERHLRDVLASRIHPPQDDTALTGIGSRVLSTYRS